MDGMICFWLSAELCALSTDLKMTLFTYKDACILYMLFWKSGKLKWSLQLVMVGTATCTFD